MFIGGCLLTILLLMLLRYKLYNIKPVLLPFLAIGVGGMGLFGTYIMFFIENGGWYGRSFFGAVLFFPIVLSPLVFLFRIPLKKLLDFSTPPGLAILAIYKWNCYTDGCCGGKVLWFSESGVPTYFPSQLAEMGAAIIIAITLMILERNCKFQQKIYPLCLILYGVTRYILNCYRWEQTDFLFGIPAGNFWSVISVLMGILWMFMLLRQGYTKRKVGDV